MGLGGEGDVSDEAWRIFNIHRHKIILSNYNGTMI